MSKKSIIIILIALLVCLGGISFYSTFAYNGDIDNLDASQADYNLIYGSLANVVILLFWLYILAYIFVIGLFLNRQNTEVEKKKTNTIALEEIRKKVKENQKQE